MSLEKTGIRINIDFGSISFLGKDCEVNLNDCPGSCNIQFTKHAIDKIAECECICLDGYKGINCTVNILRNYYKSILLR